MFERFTDRGRRVLVLAQEQARLLGHNYIGTEHLLLGLVREGEGVAVQVLIALGADLARVRQQVILLLSGHPAGDREVQGPTSPGLGGPGSARQSGPRCPACRTLLEGQVAYRVLPVAPEPNPGVEPLQVAFVYCRRCGVTIAHTPAGPDQPGPMVASGRLVARAGSHGRAPVPARELSDELWNAPPPASVPPPELVDVRHSGRFRDDGKLQGTVSGSTGDVTLELPRSASSATGTLGDWAFEIFAAMGGSLERARVRGSYDGRAVHLDLTTTGQGDATITGSCPASPPFALLLIASLRYFA